MDKVKWRRLLQIELFFFSFVQNFIHYFQTCIVLHLTLVSSWNRVKYCWKNRSIRRNNFSSYECFLWAGLNVGTAISLLAIAPSLGSICISNIIHINDVIPIKHTYTRKHEGFFFFCCKIYFVYELQEYIRPYRFWSQINC